MAEQHFTTPGPVRLEVKVEAGEVRVATVDGDESSVTLEGSQKLIDATRVDLVGDGLVIEQRRRSFLGRFGYFEEPLHVHARVPHRSRVGIGSVSGGVTLDGTFGGLERSLESGDARVTGEVDGDASVKVVRGDVRLPRLAGDLTVRTVSGDAAAESVDGSVSLKSVSGDVHVGSLREGMATVRSVSGDIELGIPSGTSFDVDAVSGLGDVSSEVPLSDTPGTDPSPTVVIRSRSVRGDFRIFRAA